MGLNNSTGFQQTYSRVSMDGICCVAVFLLVEKRYHECVPLSCVCAAVHIEEIVLRGISRTRTDKEYNFEVGNDTQTPH